MTDLDKYLFDLRGYMVVEDVLSADEVSEMNQLIDSRFDDEVEMKAAKRHQGGYLSWGQPFVDLLDHERIMPQLKFIVGDGFRLDHYYAIYADEGADRLNFHGGNRPYDPPEYYHFRNDRMFNGLTVVSWQLCDVGPDEGGFCCIPGSHKSNWPTPPEIEEAHTEVDCVTTLKAKAGSVVIFTEALTHGSAPWIADHQRRSLLFKYSPAQQSWSKNHIKPPEGVSLTDRQKLLFEPPYFNQRQSLFDDAIVGKG